MPIITQDDLHNKVPKYLEKLDECPFCHKRMMGFSFRKRLYKYPPEYSVRFRCKSCHCGTGKSTDLDKLVKLWNSAKR